MRNFENLVMKRLREEGIVAESIEIVKNNVSCKGIRVYKEGSDVSPIVYYSEQENVEAFLQRVYDTLNSDIKNPVMRLTDPVYVKDHVYLSVQKPGEEDVVRKQYLNLELFMRITLDLGGQTGNGSVKVTPGLVAQLGIAEDELWRCASANSHAGASVRSMSEILGLPDTDGEQSLYVATTGQLTGGASVLYFPEVFKSFCENYGEEACYMLPSSTEEILVLRETALDDGYLTVDELVHMVETVNKQVDPLIQLTPAVYRYSIATDAVEIIATL